MNVINFKYVCIIFIMGKTGSAINGMCDSHNGLHDEDSEFSDLKTINNYLPLGNSTRQKLVTKP